MLVTPRYIFPAQMSFWMSAIQWPMNHIHHKLKISKLKSYFSSKPGIFAFFCISINRIVFPIFEAQNFRIILFLFLSLTLHIHLMSDPVDSTFRMCPQTNHSELSPLHTTSFLVWITAVASDLFPYFHVCVLLLSVFNLESVKTDCSKPSTQMKVKSSQWSVRPWAIWCLLPAAWPPVSLSLLFPAFTQF